jgi:hypothetical protein
VRQRAPKHSWSTSTTATSKTVSLDNVSEEKMKVWLRWETPAHLEHTRGSSPEKTASHQQTPIQLVRAEGFARCQAVLGHRRPLAKGAIALGAASEPRHAALRGALALPPAASSKPSHCGALATLQSFRLPWPSAPSTFKLRCHGWMTSASTPGPDDSRIRSRCRRGCWRCAGW